MDVKSAADRSLDMAAIRGKDTKPEIKLRLELWRRGYRYRKNFRGLPGKPDIVFLKPRICVFVDGEFFHGKGFFSGGGSHKYDSLEDQLKHANHSDFWLKKIRRNMERDEEVNALLRQEGWLVIRFWSKDVMKETDRCVATVEEALTTRIGGREKSGQ